MSWYALQVIPRREKGTARALRDKGFQELLPLYRSARRWSDRIEEVELPLFPSYVFCRFDLTQTLTVLKTPGVKSVVRFGSHPVPIADSEIAALQTILASRLSGQPWPFLQAGQTVRIEIGPLAGLEGILLELKSRHRLVVSVTLLQRSVAIDVEASWVAPTRIRTCAPQLSQPLHAAN